MIIHAEHRFAPKPKKGVTLEEMEALLNDHHLSNTKAFEDECQSLSEDMEDFRQLIDKTLRDFLGAPHEND